MTNLTFVETDRLESDIQGQVIRLGATGYDEARRV